MEEVKGGFVFKIVLFFFLISFIFSVYFGQAVPPTISELARAIFSPFESVGDPLSDFTASLSAIADFIDGGGLPSLENLLDLFTLPFKMLLSLITAVIELLGNLVEVFS